jgi:hypothetical protein
MTLTCCPDCRLRFGPAVTAQLKVCPQCGAPVQALPALAGAVGFRLFRLEDLPATPMPEAISVSLPVPDPTARRS